MGIAIANTSGNCRCIKVPNLCGYNLFFPQAREESEFMYKHLNKNALDVDVYPESQRRLIKFIVKELGYRDVNVEQMHTMGYSNEEICSYSKMKWNIKLKT